MLRLAVDLDGVRLSISDLVELWILAERMRMPRLQNQALNTLDQMRGGAELIPQSTYKRVYDRTKDGSPLRRYIVSLVSRGKSPLTQPFYFPHQMLYDVVNQMKKVSAKSLLRYTDDELRSFYVPQVKSTPASSLPSGKPI